MGVENSGYIFIAVVMFALCSASQMFGGYFSKLTGFAPAAARTTIQTAVDGLSGLLCCAGLTIFVLAFLSRPGR